MIEVEVQNFQSVERVSLRIDGFTAIAGRSNIGKSSIVRALQCALTGAAGTDFVRHGPSCERRLKGNKKCKCQTTVTIKLSSMELTWEKGDAVNQYTVIQEGVKKVYTAVDRGTPEFLKPQFQPTKIGSSNELVQVSEQFSPIFLLNQSGPAVADVLSDVARLDNINDALRLANKDRKEAVATRKVREGDIAQLREDLGQYEGLEDAASRVPEVEFRHEALQTLQGDVDLLEDFISRTINLGAELSALRAATKPELPDFKALGDAGDELVLVTDFVDRILERAPVIRQLQGVEKVELPDFDPVTEAEVGFDRLEGWVAQLDKLDRVVAGLETVTEVQELDSGDLAQKAKQLEWLAGRSARLETLTVEQDRLTAELEKAVKAEQAVLEEYAELGVCPTCSQNIEGEHQHG